MARRNSIGTTVAFLLMLAFGVYLVFSAIQGPSGIMQRIELKAETRELQAERDALRAEVEQMRNLTRRLSDDYLDLDLLDERARAVLGLGRADEVMMR
ncbi:MAG: septum formation initiator family protein [Paracoccus sp. (in: a-proteobacteria)]|uniref:FtsB family cell division protein n=1 Tax=Paracoccus sp. TaxID=267 RepID=UPI0026DF3FCF|nr:septum formation initiator family protein [Paracoccus sp. (in: a-proteobacteria)]MDO5620101.1 septum formation initiator family protein [Paracoccus sp. (in: a-proteobacteria)]